MWLTSTLFPYSGKSVTVSGPVRTCKTTQDVRWRVLVLGVFLCLSLTQSWGQGYIYVHKRTLNEESSPNFTFNGSGSIGTFTLNDQPTHLYVRDLGAGGSGRLWAIAEPAGSSNAVGSVYYRDVNNSNWIQQAGITAGAIDGDAANGNVFVNTTSGNTFRFTAPSTIVALGTPGNYGNQLAVDVTSSWQGTIAIATNAGSIWKWTGGVNWTVLAGSVEAVRVDASPVNGDIIFATKDGSVYRMNSSGGAFTSLGKPNGLSLQSFDLTYDAQGNIFVLDGYGQVYRWTGGFTWVWEREGGGPLKITGGVAGQIWAGPMFVGELSGTIISRTADGKWIDDERVRTETGDNSVMIQVAAGSYTITETVPSGWALQDITIYDPTSNSNAGVSGASATLNVSNGEVVHVVFQNGLVQTFPITNSCGVAYKEDFGTGSVGTYGPPLTGQTSYHYQTNTSLQTPDGYYSVIGRSSDTKLSIPANMFDHSTGNGTGRMMFVNASYEKGEFFRRRFSNLIPGATYNFSAWIASINNSTIQPNVQFEVRDASTGALLASNSSGNITPALVWNQRKLVFQSPSAQIDLVLRNNNIGGNGNDLVLDDITFSLATDLGDAPDSYKTTLASGGPCHVVLQGLHMGATADPELEGVPAAVAGNAIGDDLDNTDDEDGVTFPPLCSGMTSYTIAVTNVTNTVAPSARLIAWIDFNGNGTFEPSEGTTVAAGTSGTYNLVWTGLSGLVAGNTYARIRLTSDATITTNTPGGSAADGEVEDYQIVIYPGGGTVTPSVASLTTCSGAPVSITYTTSPAGQTTNWVRMPGNITGAGNVIDYPTATGTTPVSYTYTAMIPSVYGCPGTAAVTVVTVNPIPVVTPSVCSQTICSGQTGTIAFTSNISGSTIHWVRTPTTPAPASGTGDISQQLLNTGPTSVTYTYKIWADSPAPASCPSSSTITCEIVVTPGLNVTAFASSTATCVGSPLSLSASVAQTGSYTYSWTGPNGFVSNQQNPQVSALITAAMGGSYTVVVTDAAGCSGTAVVNAVVQNCCDLMVSATPTSITSCQTPNTGAITITYTGSGMYEYRLNGSSAQTLGASPAIISNLTAGSYTLVVQTVGDPTCSRTLETFVLPPPATIIAATSNSPICSGSSLALMATSGFVSYNWTGPNGFTSNQQNPSIPAATTATSGVYTVQVVTAAGCTGSSSTTVTIADQPNMTITGTTGMTVCSGQSATLNVGGANGAVVTWTNNLGQSGTGTTIDFAGILNTSGQPQTITYAIIANAGACSDRETVTLTVNPAPFLLVVPQQAVICANEQSNIVATATPSIAAITWTRTPVDGTGTGSVTINETLPAGSYNYTLTATTGGCSNTVTVPLTVNN